MWGGKCPMTLENVLDAHERTEINVTIVSNAAHYLRDRSQADLIKAIRLWSDYAAEIQRDNKGKLSALPRLFHAKDLSTSENRAWNQGA
jgi:hypothetical protein